MQVSATLICIDDFERKSTSLSTNEILGLLSLLTEQRACKVVLIFNSNKLAVNDDFHHYKEKVIDAEISLSPTCDEAVNLALDNQSKSYKFLAEFVTKLGVTNIRTIRKVEAASNKVLPLLSTYHADVSRHAIRTLTLIGWSYYSPQEAPPVSYVKSLKNDFALFAEDKNKSDEERKWDAKLRAYGFEYVDDFDLALVDVIVTGYLDDEVIVKTASVVNQLYVENSAAQAYSKTWDIYHDSFEDNERALVDAISVGTKKHIANIGISNLNASVKLLRQLGKDDLADALIDSYIEFQGGVKHAFDIEGSMISTDGVDERLGAKFQAERERAIKNKTILEILDSMAENGGWNQQDEEVLAAASTRDYLDIFMNSQGKKLNMYIKSCLDFGRFANATPRQKLIGSLVEEALKSIGKGSRLNALRVGKFGIHIESESIEGIP